MQVFVPYTDFALCAKCLDSPRLLKQLVEVYQILLVINNVPKEDGSLRKGWVNHPAVVQWRPWPGALARYADAVADECDLRHIETTKLRTGLAQFHREGELPSWWGDEDIHSSHRARLLQKDFDYYRAFGWHEAEDPNLAARDYWWPVPQSDGTYSKRQKAKR